MSNNKLITQQTSWRIAASTHELDPDTGQITTTDHLVESQSGHDFTVSITGHKSVDVTYFIAALKAAAAALQMAVGIPLDDNASTEPSKTH